MIVADVMTREVVTCSNSDNLNRAAQLMWERRCGCLPIVDDDNRVVGLLTDRDVCMAAYTQGRRLDDIGVATAMSRPAWTCAPSAKIEEAEDLLMAHGIRRLVVVDADGRPSGLVSLDDIALLAAKWDGKGEIDLERVALTLGEVARRNLGPGDEEPPTEVPQTDLVDFVQNSLAALKTLGDEIRVDLNLAGKQVRDRLRRPAKDAKGPNP